jgi:hypothetical protein
VRTTQKGLISGDIDVGLLYLSDILPEKDKFTIVGVLPREIYTPTGIKKLLGVVPSQLYVARAEAEATITGKPADFDRALALEADMLYTEPPPYPRPILEPVARRALRNLDFKTAETHYRQLLEHEPGSGRALWGLAEALAGQEKTAEAQPFRDQFRKVWANADPNLP